ncbi:(2Fe-2S)-binding protein [Candidatus Peregrinibacteria bacterium]|jgi:ferredoxin|nr:(2Fe-2S)-binding protein [Candidatus Peregrinibacteria bacterium]MBT4631536.1 (2Fe-2S)-binding protein [Candidatus Peregrinibacteria bacterium]MBT5516369.1 (2Fe-2S)-binding protein [Candidatus Peregrinibacteria bacterium]MBT5824274.1 (2Fe-2S)-binding protein [Candidatus Peregrinibacteria bacterium]
MPKITNTSSGTSADCEEGGSFREAAQAGGLGIPFGCENGICSTCLIKIGSGMENLSERTDQEEMTLDARGADDNVRLACQCKVNGDVSFEQ